jgi:glycosyltransferase involved in cell wall biosynthesis
MEHSKLVVFDGRFISSENKGGISRDSSFFLEGFEKDRWRIRLLNYQSSAISGTEKEIYTPIVQAKSYRREVIRSFIKNEPIRIPFPYDVYFQSQICPINVVRSNKNETQVVRVHDLFPVTNPEWFTKTAVYHFRAGLYSIPEESLLVANSSYTLMKLEEVLGSSFNRFHTAIVPCKTQIKESFLLCGKCKLCLNNMDPKNFLLAVGTVEPRKNYGRMLKAWELSKLRLGGVRLVIVGRNGWKQDNLLRKLKNTEGVYYVDSVCDFQLNKLYFQSLGFISTSLDEGYNMSLDEAISFQKPCLLSSIDVHRERIYGNSSLWFDPHVVESIVDALDLFSPALVDKPSHQISTNWAVSFQIFSDLLKTLSDRK